MIELGSVIFMRSLKSRRRTEEEGRGLISFVESSRTKLKLFFSLTLLTKIQSLRSHRAKKETHELVHS